MSFVKPKLSARELEVAFESIGEATVVVNNHGHIIRANQAALKLLSYSESELIGQPFLTKVKALNIEAKPVRTIDRPIVRAVIEGRPVYEYLYYQGKKPTRIPVFVSASPIIKDSKPIGLIEIFRDISVEETIDQMKSEFISLASHQLRTPLSSIKTYSHMLLDGYMGELDSQKRPALEIILAATNRMNELISTLLNITRLESGAIVIEKKQVDIAKITQEILEEMAIPAKNRTIKLSMMVRGKYSTKIRSDGPIIKEILTNLVSNSVKYSKDHGQVVVKVITSPTGISVIVKDDGVGIPGPAKAQIFSKFFRAHNVIQLETNGTGLGLYLVKGLVDEIGGKISFTSEEGQGTTFRVSLPRKVIAK